MKAGRPKAISEAAGVSRRHGKRLAAEEKADAAAGHDNIRARKLLAQTEKLEAEKEQEQIKTKALKAEYVSKSELSAAIETLGLELKQTLGFYLKDKIPTENAGLDAARQRENNTKFFREICERFQDFAERWGI